MFGLIMYFFSYHRPPPLTLLQLSVSGRGLVGLKDARQCN